MPPACFHHLTYTAVANLQVSAEVASVSLEHPVVLKKIHKSTDAEEGIRAAMQHCFLFTGMFWFVHGQTLRYADKLTAD